MITGRAELAEVGHALDACTRGLAKSGSGFRADRSKQRGGEAAAEI
jgi:hypothetical protein